LSFIISDGVLQFLQLIIVSSLILLQIFSGLSFSFVLVADIKQLSGDIIFLLPKLNLFVKHFNFSFLLEVISLQFDLLQLLLSEMLCFECIVQIIRQFVVILCQNVILGS